MKGNISPGIPLVSDYRFLLGTDLFAEMERFSDAFVKNHENVLEDYGRRWVFDPLHQWSRQWEYPFAYYHIKRYLGTESMHPNRQVRLLDAGSGCTFFPYYLSHSLDCKVCCWDQDSCLGSVFREINRVEKARVEFKCHDLRERVYEEHHFDMIYCISVLEHTRHFKRILQQFRRLLKQNGLLIITFDISLSKQGLTLNSAKTLLNELDGVFMAMNNSDSEKILDDAKKRNILTSRFIWNLNKDLLPWRPNRKFAIMQILKLKSTSLLSVFSPKRLIPNLTVFCGVWRNAKPQQ